MDMDQTSQYNLFRSMDMDQTNQYNLPSVNQFTGFHFPRNAIPIILSLSLFPLLFSFSSYLPFLLSTFSVEVLLSYSTDRKYIFLLCNGILAFLITRSGLIAKSPLVKVLKVNHIGEFRRSELELSERKHVITEVALEVEEKEEEGKENRVLVIVDEKEEEEENKFDDAKEEEEEENKFDDTKEEEEEKEEEENMFDDAREEEEEENMFDDAKEEEDEENMFDDASTEEEEEEGIGFLSLEELNKKCDAFIKLMREGIIT